MKELFEKIICEDCTDKDGNITNKDVCPSCQNKRVEYRPLSPAELEGRAWVLEELKKRVGDDKLCIAPTPRGIILRWIQELESRIPISELEQEIKEDRRRARAWDALESWVLKSNSSFYSNRPDETILNQMKELLIQSKKPPKAEEESDGK